MQTKYLVLGGGALALAGCSGREAMQTEAELGELHAAVSLDDVESDVTAMRFDIVPLGDDCDAAPVASQVVSLAAAPLPDLLATPGVHAYANGLFVLDVGSYRVCATPLAGVAPSEMCSPVDANVDIEAQTTAEVALFAQCLSPEQGAVDVVVSLNQAPSITEVTLTPSKYISECESVTAVASATDPNDDTLTYAWSIADGPAGATLQATTSSAIFSGLEGDYTLALEVDDGHGGTKSLEFPVHVSDAECGPDVTPPAPISGLSATIESRRETSIRLAWTPPSEIVAGYQVAYLELESSSEDTISEDNFDDLPRVADVLGGASGVLLHDLTIEREYAFAVRPFDAAGNLGPVVATAEPIAARFQSLVLAPPDAAPPGTLWAYSVDASTDLNSDGRADLVVGQKYGDRVYVYLAQSGGTYPAEPTVTVVGPPDSGFGASVAVIGNVVGDAHEDIAIAAPTDGPVLGRIYVVSITDFTEDTVDLSHGSNPTGSIIDFPTTSPYPSHVVRLGDFDGDGDLDFGIHAVGYGAGGACDPETLENCDGALIVIKGTATPASFPSVVTVPDDTALFEAYVPSSLGFYGDDWLLGITDVVGGRSGVLAAEYQAGVQRLITRNSGTGAGFSAQLLDYGPPEFADDELVYDTEIGSYPAALAGANLLALQLTNARDGLGTTPGIVDVYTLSSTNTFGAPYRTFKASGETNNFGQVLVGNRHSGRPASYDLPFFGRDAQAPALIMGGRYYANKLPKLFMLRAETIAGLPQDLAGQELTDAADVEYLLGDVPGVNTAWTDALGMPSADADWHGGLGFAIHDMNGDGFTDLGVAEWEEEATYTGGIIVLY